MPSKTAPPATVDDYLASAPKDQRAALTKLRRTIKAAAPKATESVSYGIVGYKHNGKRLVYFGYAKEHLALYGDFAAYGAELESFDQSGKGTIRFSPDRPISDRLLTKMVKGRIAQIEKAGT